jgi:hypothetical protein
MRIRTVKPEFFKHGGLYDAEQETGFPIRLAYEGLWCCADREGRFKWKPRELKLDVLPYDDVDFSSVMDELATRGYIVKYRYGENVFGYIPTFLNHQSINNRESASVLPGPPVVVKKAGNSDEPLTRDPCDDHAASAPLQWKGTGREREGKGREPASTTRANQSTSSKELRYPLSAEAQALTDKLGIFETKQQADMNDLLQTYCKANNTLSVEAAIKLMVSRWDEYCSAKVSGLLEFDPYSSAYKFFMSGKWEEAEMWNWKPGVRASKAYPTSTQDPTVAIHMAEMRMARGK